MIKSSGEEEKFVHIFSFAIYKFLERSEGGGGTKTLKGTNCKRNIVYRQHFQAIFPLEIHVAALLESFALFISMAYFRRGRLSSGTISLYHISASASAASAAAPPFFFLQPTHQTPRSET